MRRQCVSFLLWMVAAVAAEDDDVCAPCADCCLLPKAPNDDHNNRMHYNCSLPGLESFQPGQYQGIQVNYLSYWTETSSPNLPIRAAEFQACTGGSIVFSEASNAFEDPVRDLGTQTVRGSELYDGYFMSYSHFPEVSALGLAEHLNDRIRQDAARLQWEDMLPAVKSMGEYRKDGKTNIDFLMYDGDFFVPIIRLDLLEKHNLPLPNTWEEVVEYAKFFNGTDLNEDGEEDFGLCHFPRLGAGYWDWWWAENLYSTWATIDQTHGIQQGFFFDVDTMEPNLGAGFRKAAEVWKELWTHGAEGCITPNLITGRCAIGFAPPGCWKGVFLNPDGIARKDDQGQIVWRPTMKSGEYAEPYRFKPFGSLQVADPHHKGELTTCTPQLCPKAERIPARGHHGDADRASVLPPSPLEGQLINRSPFYWSGGLGTLIRKSSPIEKKDLMWDFFVYTNSPVTSVYDVANYASWLDSWRHSQLSARENFLQAGWSPAAYEEHASVMNYAFSSEGNGAFNLRLPGTAKYTRDAVGERMRHFIEGNMTLDTLVEEVTREWNEITDQQGRLEQLEIYRAALGLDSHSEVELCRLHRASMDDRDPSVCRKYDETSADSRTFAIVLASVLVAAVLIATIMSLTQMEHKRRQADSLWQVKASELDYGHRPQIIGYGSFGVVLLAEYRGTKVAVKRVLPDSDGSLSGESTAGNVSIHFSTGHDAAEMGIGNPGYRSMGHTLTSLDGSKLSHKKRKMMTYGQRLRQLKADFIMEMRTIAKLRHPNITTTMGAVLEKGQPSSLVMEYMENGSLYEAMRNETLNLNSQDDILIIAQDIAHGMRFLHSADVIHGDLKSKNVLIDSNLRAKVADFGLSAKSSKKARGTPYWMAPELLNGESVNDERSDVYAFGVLLYEVYSGKEPYEGEVYADVIRAVRDPAIRKRPPVPSRCPLKVASLMQDCLQHSPIERPTSKEVDEMLQAEGTIQGRIFRIQAINKDLAEQNRQISAEQATQLGHFACMSHEIRTPLNCIIGVSSLLEDDDKLDKAYMESIKMIVSSSKLLKQVVDDVLDFSKFVSGNAEIDIQRADLQETLANIVRSMGMSPITERKNISLRIFFDPLTPQYVETDDRRLQQILYNLMSNAVKFSKDNGHVDLTVSIESSPNKPQRLELQVKDYGQGIEAADFEDGKLFQPFFQTTSGKKSVDGGTGLGLAITKQLTELLGGSIAVDSRVGEWTKFSVNLPLAGSGVDIKATASRLKSCCICLVSTEELEIQYMFKACEFFGVDLHACDSLNQLEDQFARSGTSQLLACLVQEDLFVESIYERVSKRNSAVLVTFGPTRRVDRGQIHYHSLTQKVPVVLLQEVGSICEYGSLKVKLTPRSNEAAPTVGYDNLRILVAEDNKMSQRILVRMMVRLGVNKEFVTTACDGKEAVELEAESDYDLVFLDIQMPIMDGLEACQHIVSRKRAAAPCPKVVFLSANLASDYQAKTIQTGATDYLSKPIALEDLRKLLAKLL